MDYHAALIWFRDRSDYDRGFISNPFAGDDAALAGLRRTRNLLDALGGPDRAYPIIHVAGTKGKGSTCAFIESVARARGLRTGMFVTPHLHSVRERTQVDGRLVSELQFSRLIARSARAVEQVEAEHAEDGRLTAFEISTAMSLLAFSEAGVELAVVEVGLGGRLDATNVIEPRVSVITPVSYDHEAILGNTLGEIAAEKAGIIRPGIPVVVAPQAVGALAVIREAATQQGAPLLLAGADWTVAYERGVSALSGPWRELRDIRLGLMGAHQADNAGAALMSLRQYRPDLLDDLNVVRTALESTRWPGRFEKIHEKPAIIADGAHNPASMRVLVEALRDAFNQSRYIFVFGSYTDKNLAGMLSELVELNPTVIGVRSRSPRARDPEEIRREAARLGLSAFIESSVDAALNRASSMTGPDEVIVVTGSLSVVAEAREAYGLGKVSELEQKVMSR
jgi:dihydrofolate synthase/folylpolyglutamate synthase